MVDAGRRTRPVHERCATVLARGRFFSYRGVFVLLIWRGQAFGSGVFRTLSYRVRL